MGGQAPKIITLERSSQRYTTKVGKELSGTDLARAARYMAPYVVVATGHRELAVGMKAAANIYIKYQKTGDLNRAAFEGVKTVVVESTAGMIASSAIDTMESSTGLPINRELRFAMEYGLGKGIKYLEEKGFERVEWKTWPT